jgi:hypothetical protein
MSALIYSVMKTKLIISFAALVLLIAGTSPAIARDEYTKTLKKEFTVNPGAGLILDNKFGKVHCNDWDRNVISIEVTISVEASSETAAGKLFDKVNIVLSGTASQVEGRTVFDGEDFHGKNRLSIDYEVNMPASVNLDLTNKFGDIYINRLDGTGKIALSYGNMEVHKLNNTDNLLTVNFGQADITSIAGAVVSLKYSKMDLEYAGSLRLDSKYSDLDASRVISMTGSFEGGKLSLDNSSVLDSKSKFSDIQVSRLETSLNLDIQYGNCDIEDIPAEFSSITIRNKYGNVSLGIAKGASYSLEADMKFCDLSYPEDKASFSQRIKTNTTQSYKGFIGKAGNSSSKVNIKSEYGNVSLD